MSSSLFTQTLSLPHPAAFAQILGDTPGPVRFFCMHIHKTGNCTPPYDKTGIIQLLTLIWKIKFTFRCAAD